MTGLPDDRREGRKIFLHLGLAADRKTITIERYAYNYVIHCSSNTIQLRPALLLEHPRFIFLSSDLTGASAARNSSSDSQKKREDN